MTRAEAEAILGPELSAQIAAHPTAPLTEAQIDRLVALLDIPESTGKAA